MSVVICPGIHDPDLTKGLLAGLELRFPNGSNLSNLENVLVFSASDQYSALSTLHILQFLHARLGIPSTALPVVFIGFSAGVVGAIGAAWVWQILGGKVKALIAVDGWGMPLVSNFPCHRISHDFFTHWSSSLLGSGQDSFYADPSVEHLTLWRSPQTVTGWSLHPVVGKLQTQTRLTAAEFLTMLLKRYGEIE